MVKLSCGSGKGQWPFRDWVEATGCCSTIRCLRVPYPNCSSDTGIHMTWRIGQEVGDHVSPSTEWIVQFAWRLWGIVQSLHAACRCAISDVMASGCLTVCTDHPEPATCFPVEISESCPEASLNSWSNNWVNWWPVLPVSCGSLLALRDFGKFMLDPHLSSLGRIFHCDHNHDNIGTQ